MPLQATSGAASYDAFGGGAAAVPQYIEDVFSCFLYAGNGSTQTITNGIDLSGKGGLVWIKNRTSSTLLGDPTSHQLVNTVTNQVLRSDLTDGATGSSYIFNSNGFVAQSVDSGFSDNNTTGQNYASWTFRKQPKFFDVLTYTGTGSNTTIAHSLGSVPACIIVKRTDTTGAWQVYHRSLANTEYLVLNTTAAKATGATRWNSTTPTSTVFSLGTDATVNASGGTYVAYLFAHDAGGFGLTGTDNVISCGSYVGDGLNPGPTITLGYEPQFVMIKRATGDAGNWIIMDSMRDLAVNGDNKLALRPNLSNAETTQTNIAINATGFVIRNLGTIGNAAGETYIYIAIRRGPMKVPTSGTSVFSPLTYSGTGTFPSGTDPNSGTATRTISSSLGFDVDMSMTYWRSGGSTPTPSASLMDKLRGIYNELRTYDTSADSQDSNTGPRFSTRFSRGFALHDYGVEQLNISGQELVTYVFGRAPSFFDVVCYTGTGSARTVAHNLGAVPELMIVKQRSSAGEDWYTYSSATGNTKYLYIDGTASAQVDSRMWNNTTPTSSVFTVGTYGGVNSSGVTLVAYLFATCAGVSKVGSYTGNGSTQTIDCGFGAGGARFVLIKRTDSTGNWYVYDTARGMTTLTDPYLLLNTTAAESATLGSVTTVSTGFALNSTILAAINVSAATYIFLAIA